MTHIPASARAKLRIMCDLIAQTSARVAIYYDFKEIRRTGDDTDLIGVYAGPWEPDWLFQRVLEDLGELIAAHPPSCQFRRGK